MQPTRILPDNIGARPSGFLKNASDNSDDMVLPLQWRFRNNSCENTPFRSAFHIDRCKPRRFRTGCPHRGLGERRRGGRGDR
jgi:hypothetical protein